MNPFTSSKATKVIGAGAVLSVGMLLLFGLVFSGPDLTQKDSVRLFYIHVPSVLAAYSCFALTAVASIIYLRKASEFWDLVAGSAAEIGVLFTGFVLATGMLWGQPTWGTYWDWDPRLTSTAIMFIMYLGYLALRSLDLPREVKARRSAVVGIVSLANIVIVHYSVQWWRGLHQGQTLGLDPKLSAAEEAGPKLMGFSLFLGCVAMMLSALWLLIHRFRLAWLSYQVEVSGFETALEERRGDVEVEIDLTQHAVNLEADEVVGQPSTSSSEVRN